MTPAPKLTPYFFSHLIKVRTNLPFKQTLGRLDLSGQMVKWAVELGEYEVEFEPRMAIKAHALAKLPARDYLDKRKERMEGFCR